MEGELIDPDFEEQDENDSSNPPKAYLSHTASTPRTKAKALKFLRKLKKAENADKRNAEVFTPPIPQQLSMQRRAQIPEHNLKTYFLKAYNGLCGHVIHACILSRIDEAILNSWMETDKDFKEKKEFLDRVIDERTRMIVFQKAGAMEPIVKNNISDSVLMFLGKSKWPKEFGEGGKEKGGTINITFGGIPRPGDGTWVSVDPVQSLPPPSQVS